MHRRLAVAVISVVALASCSSGKKASPPPPTSPLLDTGTSTTLPATPVVAKVLSPEKGSVQGNAGRGMVVVLSFSAADPNQLPAQFRLGGALPTPAPAVKPGHNPAFPGLVVALSTTAAALGGPTANLANLFQIVSPAKQPDGSMQVSAVWTNADANFGTDTDVTLVALTVSGTAPDTVPTSPEAMSVNSNPAQVTFHLGGAAADTSGSTTTSTVKGATTSSSVKPTTTTAKGATTVAPATATTVRPATTTPTTKPPATTSTTKLLGLIPVP